MVVKFELAETAAGQARSLSQRCRRSMWWVAIVLIGRQHLPPIAAMVLFCSTDPNAALAVPCALAKPRRRVVASAIAASGHRHGGGAAGDGGPWARIAVTKNPTMAADTPCGGLWNHGKGGCVDEAL